MILVGDDMKKDTHLIDDCKSFVKANALFSVFKAEAIHIGSLIAAQGYIFPISDHVLTLKDDGTLYRFQVSLSISYHVDCILAAVVSRM